MSTALCFSCTHTEVKDGYGRRQSCQQSMLYAQKVSVKRQRRLILTSKLANELSWLFYKSLQHLLCRRRLVEICDCLYKPTEVPRLSITCKAQLSQPASDRKLHNRICNFCLPLAAMMGMRDRCCLRFCASFSASQTLAQVVQLSRKGLNQCELYKLTE